MKIILSPTKKMLYVGIFYLIIGIITIIIDAG